MIVGFGKHAELSAERLLLAHADYVAWLLKQKRLSGRAAQLRKFLLEDLIPAFDARPVVAECWGRRCSKIGVYATGYVGIARFVEWWCEDCTPVNSGNLMIIKTYRGGLRFAARCRGRRTDYKKVIRAIGQGKGLPRRVTDRVAKEFLYSQRSPSGDQAFI